MAIPDLTHNYAKSYQKTFFYLYCNIIIINTNTRKIFYNAHVKPHTDYVSAVWGGCSEENLKKYLTFYIEVQANKSYLILPYLHIQTLVHLEF